MPTAINVDSSGLVPTGWRVRSRARIPIWLVVVALTAAGAAGASIVLGLSTPVAIGTLATLIAVGAAAYRLSVGLSVLVFAYPFDLTTWAGPLKLTTSAALMGILVFVWAVRQFMCGALQWRRTPLDVPVALFAVATAMSLFGLAGHLQDQLVGLLKAVGGFVMFFIATQTIQDWRDCWLVLAAVMATGLVQATGITIAVLSGTGTVGVDARTTGTVIDPNIFAGYLLLIIPSVVSLGLAFRRSWMVPVTMLAAAVFGVALAATLSRSGWLGLLGALVVLAVLARRRLWSLAVIVGSLVGALVLGGLVSPMAARLDPTQPGAPLDELVSRTHVWTAALGIWAQHPLVGVGLANFVNYYQQQANADVIGHAHNLFLNVAAERGVLGLLTFLIVVVALFRTLSLTIGGPRNSLERALAVGLLATFAGFLAHSLFEVSYYDYKVLLLFWLLVGLAAARPPLRPAANATVGQVRATDSRVDR